MLYLPTKFAEETRKGGSQSDWIDRHDSPDQLTPHLEHFHQDEHLRVLQIDPELFGNGVGDGLDESLPTQSAMVPGPQIDFVLFSGLTANQVRMRVNVTSRNLGLVVDSR